MIRTIEKKMLQQNAHAVKYMQVKGLKNARGITKRINQQIDRDFGLAGPFTLSSVSERVHSVRWVHAREIFVVETNVKRVIKETIAAGISQLNKCAYCEDVHGTSIISSGDKLTANAIANGSWKSLENEKTKSLIEWSLNTRNPDAEIIKIPPFTLDEAPEIIGTALEFHATNRLVSIFLEESPLPKFLTNSFIKKTAFNIASKTLFKSMVQKKANVGESLVFIKDYSLSEQHSWACIIPAYAKGIEAKDRLLDELEKEVIPERTAQLFKDKISTWQGEEMPMGKAWLNDTLNLLTENEKPIAKILFLAAFAPYTITENDINNFRKFKPTDKELLEVCYWAVQKITDRIGEWLIKPFQ